MAQGHMIPMVDIARMLAERGVVITILTTPVNANRFKSVVARANESNLRIKMCELSFPSAKAGLPEGCENFDMLPSAELGMNFFAAASMLQEPVEKVLQELQPAPCCIISDMCLPWTTDVANKFNIPRLVFHGPGCFSLFCLHSLMTLGIMDEITSDSEPFVMPGLPDRVELTKAKLSGMVAPEMDDFRSKIKESEKEAYGIVVNSFQELEPEYVKELSKAKGKSVRCIGPVSLYNKNSLDKAERGNKAAIDENHCLKWLDSFEASSVVYVCLGSLSRLSTAQMIELGLGLESSNRPFIWGIRHKPEEFERWLIEVGFEEWVKGRGLLVHGWAPQVLILSHQAIGGFLTHCGWNSTLEGVCAGVPMITWPHFADQFFNETFIVDILKIGVRIGAEVAVMWGSEEKLGVLVNKDDVMMAVDKLMDGGEEVEDRRNKARKLRDMAARAMEEGGSSYLNMAQVIQDITEQANTRKNST